MMRPTSRGRSREIESGQNSRIVQTPGKRWLRHGFTSCYSIGRDISRPVGQEGEKDSKPCHPGRSCALHMCLVVHAAHRGRHEHGLPTIIATLPAAMYGRQAEALAKAQAPKRGKPSVRVRPCFASTQAPSDEARLLVPALASRVSQRTRAHRLGSNLGRTPRSPQTQGRGCIRKLPVLFFSLARARCLRMLERHVLGSIATGTFGTAMPAKHEAAVAPTMLP